MMCITFLAKAISILNLFPKVRFTICLLLALIDIPTKAQDIGSWNILHVKYHAQPKWSLLAEGQVRSLKFYNHFHYYEYKGGAEWKVHSNVRLTMAAGSYQTYKEGGDFMLPKNNNEFRLWPQIALLQSIGNIKIEQRYRAEMRFTSNGYRNRFRYRLGISYPFGKTADDYNPYQVSISNEIFFTDLEPYFERNRALLAFSYKPSRNATLQIGYIHQLDYKINDETGRDFFQIGVLLDIYRKKANDKSSDTPIQDN